MLPEASVLVFAILLNSITCLVGVPLQFWPTWGLGIEQFIWCIDTQCCLESKLMTRAVIGGLEWGMEKNSPFLCLAKDLVNAICVD